MRKINIGFLASHGGSNMQAIINSIKDGSLQAHPAVVISNNSRSKALERAKNENIPFYHLSSQTHPAPDSFDQAVVDVLRKHETDLVILAGYMKKIGDITLKAFNGRILNIHPALLPKFGGKGMYGGRVHEAVLKAGEKVSGATVHIIDDQYDNGPILAQEEVPVLENDTPDSLAERVLKVEHKIYWQTIAKIISGEIDSPAFDFRDKSS